MDADVGTHVEKDVMAPVQQRSRIRWGDARHEEEQLQQAGYYNEQLTRSRAARTIVAHPSLRARSRSGAVLAPKK